MDELITLQETQRRLAAAVIPLCAERAPLSGALGRTLANGVRAETDMPPFDRAMLDGYAVRAEDVAAAAPAAPVVLREGGPTVFAGSRPGAVCLPGTAVRTMTGAPLAQGADAVVRVEFTAQDGNGTVRILRGAPAGEAVQPRGFGLRAGDEVAPAGACIDALTLAAIAAHGHAEVRVARRPRVALAAIGSELATAGGTMETGQLYDSNSHMLRSLVTEWGGDPLDGGACADGIEDMTSLLGALWDSADALVTTGGVAAGDGDLTPYALELLGARRLFWGVWMRPGTPVYACERGGKVALALSGNPGAAYVDAVMLLLPLLYRLAGAPQRLRGHVATARIAADPGKRPTRHTRFLRGQLFMRGAELWIDLGMGQSSGIPQRQGSALAVIGPGEAVREGAACAVIVERALPFSGVEDGGLADDALHRCFGI